MSSSQKLKLIIGLLTCFSLQLLSVKTLAETTDLYECPESIAYISGNSLSIRILPIFREIYKDLRCDTKFKPLPGRRGFLSFNEFAVDGELMRANQYLERYEVPVITSEEPIFTLTGSLWSNPESNEQGKLPLGYIMGVFWQESYSSQKGEGIPYPNDIKLVDAYNSGRIGSFTGIDMEVNIAIRNNKYTKAPIRSEILISTPMYHVLAPKYQSFMNAFKSYIEQHQPFESLNIQ